MMGREYLVRHIFYELTTTARESGVVRLRRSIVAIVLKKKMVQHLSKPTVVRMARAGVNAHVGCETTFKSGTRLGSVQR